MFFVSIFRFPKILSTENLKSTWIHPFFREEMLFTGARLNNRTKNEVLFELVDELSKSSILQNEISNDKNDENLPTTIQKCKNLHKFLQDSSDESDDETNMDLRQRARKLMNSYMDSASSSLEMLRDHKAVANLFIKYNTALRSSAASERLFSMAKNVLKMHRTKLSDSNFEKQLLLKVNRFSPLLS